MTFKLPERGSVPSYIPPIAIVAPVSGKRYIVPWWIELDDNEWQEQLELAQKYYDDCIRGHKVPSSGGSDKSQIKRWQIKDYEITLSGKQWNCTCKGFMFRKTCKHVLQCQEEVSNTP